MLDDASDLRRQISATDQRKLDEYLDSVREVEQRIEQAGKQGELQGWRPTLDKPNIPRPPDGIPQNIAEHMRLMCDILVLGFQTDTTRISTLKLNNDHSSLRFPHLGVDYMIHHLLSHSDTADWLKVNQFFVEQLAYIARKLDAIQEGERTALDNSMLLFCSSMLTGSHDATQLPVVMLGGGGGKIQDRPRARLPRQAEPPDVPAVPVDDGQDGRPPRQIRRRHRAAARRLTYDSDPSAASGQVELLRILLVPVLHRRREPVFRCLGHPPGGHALQPPPEGSIGRQFLAGRIDNERSPLTIYADVDRRRSIEAAIHKIARLTRHRQCLATCSDRGVWQVYLMAVTGSLSEIQLCCRTQCGRPQQADAAPTKWIRPYAVGSLGSPCRRYIVVRVKAKPTKKRMAPLPPAQDG